jgi:MFS family permease
VALILTYALMLFGFASFTSSRIVLSLYALDLGAAPSAVGLLVASFFVFPLALSWPIGIFSDRTGSRWPLLAGTVCGALAMLVPYFWRVLSALYFAGAMTGLAFCFYNVLLQNLVGILSKPHERARNFGNASLIGATSNFLGPLLGGFALDNAGNAAACLFVATLPLVGSVLLLIRGDILPGPPHKAPAPQGIRDPLADKGIVRILATSSLVQVGQDLFQFYIPIYGHAIGMSASIIGSLLATYAFASFVVRFAMPRLISRLGEKRLLAYSFSLGALGFVLIPFFDSVVPLALISFVFGLGMGCGQPITTMMMFNRSPEGRSGEALGLRQTVNNAMRVSAPAVFGLVASAFGLLPVFWINGFMMGAGGWLTRPQARQHRR